MWHMHVNLNQKREAWWMAAENAKRTLFSIFHVSIQLNFALKAQFWNRLNILSSSHTTRAIWMCVVRWAQMELGYLASLHTEKEPQRQHVVDEIHQKDAGMERENFKCDRFGMCVCWFDSSIICMCQKAPQFCHCNLYVWKRKKDRKKWKISFQNWKTHNLSNIALELWWWDVRRARGGFKFDDGLQNMFIFQIVQIDARYFVEHKRRHGERYFPKLDMMGLCNLCCDSETFSPRLSHGVAED